MANIFPERQTTYMPHRVFRLLSAMHNVALTCLNYYIYFDAIQNVKHHPLNDWYIATHNAYYDLCVLHWCMLFGDINTETTHYFHLVNPKFNLADNLKAIGVEDINTARLVEVILGENKSNKKLFRKFTKETLLYRNKNLIHREHDPDVVHDGLIILPLTKKIFKSVYKLNDLIIKIAATFPNAQNTRNIYPLTCFIFKNAVELKEGYLQTFPLKNSIL